MMVTVYYVTVTKCVKIRFKATLSVAREDPPDQLHTANHPATTHHVHLPTCFVTSTFACI